MFSLLAQYFLLNSVRTYGGLWDRNGESDFLLCSLLLPVRRDTWSSAEGGLGGLGETTIQGTQEKDMEQELCWWLTGFGRQAKPDGRVLTGGLLGLLI